MTRPVSFDLHAAVAAFVGVAAISCPAHAQTAPRHYDLAPQPLGDALRAIAVASGRNIVVATDLVDGKAAPALSGWFTPEQAVTILLRGSGLRALDVQGALVIRPLDDADEQATAADADIVVTGSRIRGTRPASTVIRIDADQAKRAGQASLGDVARSVPQSFGGGQNPAVGTNVPATNGVNVGGGSSFNLRGLGSDATLTLLDGHRLSYNASRQSIDISAIPLGAVDRVEIVPDGASAIYGSDAVAGVANIILRRDFAGLETSARLATATDGGNFEQRYGVVAGTRWASGGIVGTYEFSRTTAILGRQRSYAEASAPTLTLLPPIRNHSAIITARQEIAPGVRLTVDALYNRRWSTTSFANNAAGDLSISGNRTANDVESWAIAPSLTVDLGPSWHLVASGSYGQDRTRFVSTTITAGVATTTPRNCFCNSAVAAELSADGTLLRLPAGPVKLALGGGYRTNRFSRDAGTGSPLNIAREQESYYGYGELAVPLVSPAQRTTAISSLQATAAVRYEQYPRIGEIVTPKLGLIYAPTADLELKGSWGTSFRAPTLFQQYGAASAIVIAPSIFGGTGYPTGAAALYVQGGNPALKPERATTWSATIEAHPRALPGARFAISYFDVVYRDRIVTPIAFIGQALSNPIYRDRIIPAPNPSLAADLAAQASDFVNFTGAAFDPTRVAVIIDNRNVNAGRQTARGIDILASYRLAFSETRALNATVDATYLDSTQQISSAQPVLPLAGTIFNPPHWRARGGLDWDAGRWGVAGYVNYTGDVRDNRTATGPQLAALTTFDLTARYEIGGSTVLRGTSISLSAINLFNAKPDRITTTFLSDAPYDSTNYSPVGRLVAIRIAKTW